MVALRYANEFINRGKNNGVRYIFVDKKFIKFKFV